MEMLGVFHFFYNFSAMFVIIIIIILFYNSEKVLFWWIKKYGIVVHFKKYIKKLDFKGYYAIIHLTFKLNVK